MFQERKTKYTANKAATRLQLAQRLCSKQFSSGGVPKSIDRILVVPGQDGKYNKCSQNMLSFLLEGAVGKDFDNTTIESEALEDSVLSIGSSSVDFFHSPDIERKTVRKTANWPNKNIYTPDGDISGNAEECELFKIKSFIRMVREHSTLGFTARDPGAGSTSANAVVESWPLAMAYGLDEMKTGGFLTMKHRVLDISSGIDAVVSNIDAHSMDRILAQSVDRMSYHWGDAIATLSRAKSHSKRLAYSEADIGEPVSSFFEFEKLRLDAQGSDAGSKGVRPVCIFGKHTNEMSQNPPTAGSPGSFGFSEEQTIGNSGHLGRPALHMVMEGADPSTSVAAARSYFFTNATEQMNLFDPEALVDEAGSGDETAAGSSNEERFDASNMIKLYAAMAAGLKAAATYDSRTPLAQAFCRKKFMEQSSEAMNRVLPDGFDFTNNLVISVQEFDSAGRTPKANSALPDSERRTNCYIRIQLKNIPSVRKNVGSLGSLLIGDTFSCANFRNGEAFALTQQIPYLQSWICSRDEAEADTAVQRMLVDIHARESVTKLGNPISDKIERTSFLFGGAFDGAGLLKSLGGMNVRFFEHGVSFTHKSIGCNVLSWAKDVAYVKLLHAQNMEKDSLMVIGVSHECGQIGISSLVSGSGERELAIVLPPYDDIRQAAIDALATWKKHQDQDEDCDVGVTFTTQTGVSHNLGILQSAYSAYASDWGAVCKSFVSECLSADINGATLDTNESQFSEQNIEESSVPVTVMTGVPGCGKSHLARSIVHVTSDEIEWSVYECANNVFEAKSFQNWLENINQNSSPGKTRRALVVSPGLTGTNDIFNAVQCLTGFHVSASIACVNCGFLYRDTDSQQLIPGLVELCSSGWTTHIATVGCGAVKNDAFEELRSYLREVNSDAEFIRLLGGAPVAEKTEGAVPRHRLQDIVLSQNDIASLLSGAPFNAEKMVLARRTVPVSSTSTNNQLLSLNAWPSMYRKRFVHFLETITSPTSQLLNPAEITSENSASATNVKPTGFRALQLAAREKVLGKAGTSATTKSGAEAVKIPDHIRCFSAFGRTKIAEDGAGKIVEFGAFNGKAWIRDVAEAAAEGAPRRAGEFVFYGEKMKSFSKSLMNSLLSCAVQVPADTPARTRAMVTRDELLAIKKKHIREPPTEGYYYDGTFFTAPTGDRREFSPRMEEYVAAFLASENKTITKRNVQLSRRRKEQEQILAGRRDENGEDILSAVQEEEQREQPVA